MPSYAYRILNVFTVDGDRFSGNPLCVFEDARGLDDADMQALARQFNLSETTFVLPPEMMGADARVRIFTPGFEMPFAGHPTLGTAAVVAAGRPRVALEMRAGLVEVRAEPTDGSGGPGDGDLVGQREKVEKAVGGRFTLRAARAPVTRAVAASRAELAAMVGLVESAIAGEPLWVSTGVEQLVIPLASAADVRAAKPVPALIERHGFSEARDEAMAYLVSPEGVVRFFFTSNGSVLEDPATGSACANLGGYHVARGGALPHARVLDQGEAVHRRSRLELRVDVDRAIYVTGAVRELGRGAIAI